MVTNKKLNKLLRDPKLFFKDALRKRLPQISLQTRPRNNYSPAHTYSIVSAVYGVEKYIDQFIRSVINQTTELENIQLILVDDGSIDNSAQKIQVWCKKYPNNIFYYKKENGGQASARNFGLQYATGDWVTFIDSDDYINPEYIEEVDKLIKTDKTNRISLVCCKWRLYHESNNSFSDNHPLNYRFKNGSVIKSIKDADFMASSPATSFYKLSKLNLDSIRFDEQIKPNFEDGHFTAQYLLSMSDKEMAALCANSLYFYRKRADGSSTLDSGWEKPSRFDEVMRFGYINILERSMNSKGEVPLYIQRLVLYDISWYIKKIVNNEASISFLSTEQKENFYNYLEQIFKHIDVSTIMSFELAGIWFYHKVAMLGLFKRTLPTYQVAYIEQYDAAKKMVQLRYFYAADQLPAERVYNTETKQTVLTVYEKNRIHDFMGRVFVKERLFWCPVDDMGTISVQIGELDTRLSLNGKNVNQAGVSLAEIEKAFSEKKQKLGKLTSADKMLRRQAIQPEAKNKYRNAWMVMDRDTMADDNGEHFYRYLLNNQPQINAYFVLKADSQDWTRLANEGFRLVPYGSNEHKLLMLNAAHVVSSHPDSFTLNLLPNAQYGDMLNFKYTFLQHGVIRDDISNWLNTKKIDCFITSSPNEFESIAGRESTYKFSEKEVVLTGLARHDALLLRDEPTENVIAFMPTWRQSLVGSTSTTSTKRSKSDLFYESEYAARWKALLHSEKLKSIVEQHGYTVVFFPHANMQMYLDWFDAPAWVEVRSHQTDPILHKLFRRAKVLVTDYSSVFFEFGIQNKAILYYQFDFDEMYGSGAHTSRLGYFDFQRDGFGPVYHEQNGLENGIDHVLTNEGKPEVQYLEKMQKTLPCTDGRNCERIFYAIEKLDSNATTETDYFERLADKARTESHAENWKLAVQLWEECAQNKTLATNDEAYYLHTLFRADNLSKLKNRLSQHHQHESEFDFSRAILPYQIYIDLNEQAWTKVLEHSKEIEHSSLFANENRVSVQYAKLVACAFLGLENEFNTVISDIRQSPTLVYQNQNVLSTEIELWAQLLQGDWDGIIETFVGISNTDELTPYAQLLLSEAHLAKNQVDNAHAVLVEFEKKRKNFISCRNLIAKVEAKRGRWNLVLNQLNQAYPGGLSTMPHHVFILYMKANIHLNVDEVDGSNESVKKMESLYYLHNLLKSADISKSEQELLRNLYLSVIELKTIGGTPNDQTVENVAMLMAKGYVDSSLIIQYYFIWLRQLSYDFKVNEVELIANVMKSAFTEEQINVVRFDGGQLTIAEINLWVLYSRKEWANILEYFGVEHSDWLLLTDSAKRILAKAYEHL